MAVMQSAPVVSGLDIESLRYERIGTQPDHPYHRFGPRLFMKAGELSLNNFDSASDV